LKLEEARRSHAEAEKTASDRAHALHQRGEQFQLQQADIDRRLEEITQSTVSDGAVKKFEVRMNQVRRLEIATGYVELLQEVDNLMDQARQNITSTPRTSLTAYSRLKSLKKSLQTVQPQAEGAAPHLLDSVEQQTARLYTELKDGLESDLHKTLDRMAWPKKELNLLGDVVDSWRVQVELLLELQEPDLMQQQPDVMHNSLIMPAEAAAEPVVLLPLEVMVKPLALRFRYHFYGDRPTNRLDKPEYFLSHIFDLLDSHNSFISQLLQPILDRRMGVSEAHEALYTDATSSFVTSLLPMVSTKCLSLLPQISTQPQLLSHFVHELMSFDNTLRDNWGYTPTPGPFSEWKGLTWSMLTTHGYFNPWLNAEKDFALTRYSAIRDAADANDIDFDGTEPGKTKPTKGTIRVNDLVETITDRYRSLSSFSQKMKFLMEIQLFIFDGYHSHLHGALQAYLVGSHTAGRLIQGQAESASTGIRGVESLAKIFGSAEYLERKMSDWSDDVFFLELWDELQDRARRNTGAGGTVGRDLKVQDVAAKTSSTIKNEESDGGALFDETATVYRRLRERSEAEIIRALDTNVRNALRSYTRTSSWASLSNTDSTTSSHTASLDSVLQTLSTLLSFLSTVLAPAPLRRVTKQTCQSIQREVYDNVVLRNTFSAAGVAQLQLDVAALSSTIDSSIKITGEAHRSMRKLSSALVLLGLPIRTSRKRHEDIDEDDWGFEGDDDAAQTQIGTDGAPDQDQMYGLWEAERLIFNSNESARTVLADMGLDHLSEGDARNVIKRRIEINS